jgi:hypothetical protein
LQTQTDPAVTQKIKLISTWTQPALGTQLRSAAINNKKFKRSHSFVKPLRLRSTIRNNQ